tara:strand:+ start:38568 stop:39245 length:678 start_codon:yes stop_codon:yes gene_type:complete
VNFSIIIPVFNEDQNIHNLINEIFKIDYSYDFEIIVVNDKSTDETEESIINLKKKYSNLYLINNDNNYGQSFSIHNGVKNAKSNVIVTLDGDGQNNPLDIEKIYKEYIKHNDVFLVGGIRKNRNDSYLKIISSKIANKIRNFFLKDGCPDSGCGIKIFDKNIFLSLPFFDGMHRFLPALFIKKGANCLYVNVDHRPRKFGNSKYGTIKRAISGLLNIIKVLYLPK